MNSYDRLFRLLIRIFQKFVQHFYILLLSLVTRALPSWDWVPCIDLTQFIPDWSPWRRNMAQPERLPSASRGAADAEHATLAKDAAASIGRGDTRKTVLIKCPPERHIAVEFHEIGKELDKNAMSVNDRETYKLVCQLIESLYAQKFMTLRRNLKQNFLMFSVGAKDQILASKVGKSLPNKMDLNDKELKLVNDLTQLMAAARFHIMTQEEWTLALSETFKFNLPVDINWEFFDGKFLQNFWTSTQERKELRTVLSPIADKVLVFHRGVGVSHDSGLFLNLKLDLLIEYLIANPCKALWDWVTGAKSGAKHLASRLPRASFSRSLQTSSSRMNSTNLGPQPSLTPSPSGGQDRPALSRQMSPTRQPSPIRKLGRGDSTDHFGGGLGSPRGSRIKRETESNLASGLEHRNARTVERKTLKRLMPTAQSVVANVLQNVQLQEPMFKEVVVVYRTSSQGRNLAASAKNKYGIGKDHTTRLRHILNRRNIHIKYFHDIPMADIEAIFPDKKVYSKSISIISMVVQACMAFVAAIATMWQAGALSFHTMWSVLSLVGARAGQMYSAMQYERTRVMQDMVNILYDKMNDAQEGVLSMLLEDMAEQQLKESILAYTLLLNQGEPLTEEALDDRCERFLETTFDCRIDFAVEDALPQLLEWGLVVEDKRTHKFSAVHVNEAHAALTERWNRAYEAISKPPALKQMPLYALLPGGESELAQAGVLEEQLQEEYADTEIHSVASHEDENVQPRAMQIGISPSGRPQFKKKSRGPLHKVSKTIKGIFVSKPSKKHSGKHKERSPPSGTAQPQQSTTQSSLGST